LEVRDDDRHRGAGCPVHEGFEPLSSQYLDDPFAIMAALPLEEAPVFFAPSIGYHVVTRHADVEQVFRDPQTYSAAVAQAPLAPLVPEAQQILLAGGHKPPPSMVSLDEPAHARLRRPATRAFTGARARAGRRRLPSRTCRSATATPTGCPSRAPRRWPGCGRARRRWSSEPST
jgi:cytochrome P450